MSKISRLLGTLKVRATHHGPTALTVAGIGMLVASGVLAASRTEKIKPVVEEAEKQLHRTAMEAKDDPGFTPAEQTAERMQTYVEATKGFLVVYGPAIALGVGGAAAVLYSHGVMKRRNAALVAAYGILERGYAKYRDRVKEVVGEEIEDHIYRGHRVEVTDEDGRVWIDKGQIPTRDGHNPPEGGVSEYAVWFGPANRNWNFRPEMNLFFLRGQEKYANHRLQTQGYMMLNDIYDAIGMPRTSAGAVVGWVYNEGDGYIDFGIPEQGSTEEADYYHFFDEDTKFLLDFNVDGVVYDKIDYIRK